MKMRALALTFAMLGLGSLGGEAQNRPSPAKEEPGPGSGIQQGTGSHPTQGPRSIDQGRSVPSTKDSPDNRSYGRETDASGPSLEQGRSNSRP